LLGTLSAPWRKKGIILPPFLGVKWNSPAHV